MSGSNIGQTRHGAEISVDSAVPFRRGNFTTSDRGSAGTHTAIDICGSPDVQDRDGTPAVVAAPVTEQVALESPRRRGGPSTEEMS